MGTDPILFADPSSLDYSVQNSWVQIPVQTPFDNIPGMRRHALRARVTASNRLVKP